MRKYYPVAGCTQSGKRKAGANRARPVQNPAPRGMLLSRGFSESRLSNPPIPFFVSKKKKMLQRVPLEFFPNFSIFNGVGETTLEIAAQHRSYAARKGVFDYRLPRQFELLSILRRNEARYGESLKRAPSLNICGG